MILTADHIKREREAGLITIEPFDDAQLNPNSYNFRLGQTLLTYVNEVLDVRQEQPTQRHLIPAEGFLLRPDELYLGHTVEQIGSTRYVPMIFGRSSVARLGLFVQITAPLGDLGYLGQWTLQLSCIRPLRVYADMNIGQALFIEAQGEPSIYQGKYQSSQGPTPSKLFKDFEGKP